jgi:hypothetical protein
VQKLRKALELLASERGYSMSQFQMGHLSDDQLMLLYYGEVSVDPHLEVCAACCERYGSLRRILAAAEMLVPERGPEYGVEMWSRVERHLEVDEGDTPPPRWLWAAPIAAALALVDYQSQEDCTAKLGVIDGWAAQRNAEGVQMLIAIARVEADPNLKRKLVEHLIDLNTPETKEYLLEILK